MLAIHDALSLTRQCLLWRLNTGGYGRLRWGLGLGGPDLIGILRPTGRGFALEVKTQTGKMSPAQHAWHRAWTSAGGYVACVRSVEEAMHSLKEANEITIKNIKPVP